MVEKLGEEISSVRNSLIISSLVSLASSRNTFNSSIVELDKRISVIENRISNVEKGLGLQKKSWKED